MHCRGRVRPAPDLAKPDTLRRAVGTVGLGVVDADAYHDAVKEAQAALHDVGVAGRERIEAAGEKGRPLQSVNFVDFRHPRANCQL